MSVYVCNVFFLSVRERISGITYITFACMLPMPWPWLYPPVAALRYHVYFRFYG